MDIELDETEDLEKNANPLILTGKAQPVFLKHVRVLLRHFVSNFLKATNLDLKWKNFSLRT
jgi:hypothetical protein